MKPDSMWIVMTIFVTYFITFKQFLTYVERPVFIEVKGRIQQ
jgi:hypothetical protein